MPRRSSGGVRSRERRSGGEKGRGGPGIVDSSHQNRRDDSANAAAERLTWRAASACLHCAMGMTKTDLPELLSRARMLVPVLRRRAAETEKLRRLPDATVADLQEGELFR